MYSIYYLAIVLLTSKILLVLAYSVLLFVISFVLVWGPHTQGLFLAQCSGVSFGHARGVGGGQSVPCQGSNLLASALFPVSAAYDFANDFSLKSEH